MGYSRAALRSGLLLWLSTAQFVLLQEHRQREVDLLHEVGIIFVRNIVDVAQVGRHIETVAQEVGHDERLAQEVGDAGFDVHVKLFVGAAIVEDAEVGFGNLLERLAEKRVGRKVDIGPVQADVGRFQDKAKIEAQWPGDLLGEAVSQEAAKEVWLYVGKKKGGNKYSRHT